MFENNYFYELDCPIHEISIRDVIRAMYRHGRLALSCQFAYGEVPARRHTAARGLAPAPPQRNINNLFYVRDTYWLRNILNAFVCWWYVRKNRLKISFVKLRPLMGPARDRIVHYNIKITFHYHKLEIKWTSTLISKHTFQLLKPLGVVDHEDRKRV